MNNKKTRGYARSRHRVHPPSFAVPALNAIQKGTSMNRTIFRAAVGATALLVTATAGAAAVVIDTQQKAAAAALTTHSLFLGDNVSSTFPVMLIGLNYPSRDLVARTLGFLASATTPEALTASKGGTTLPCPLGGSFKAKLPRDGSLTLHLEWTGCTFLQYPTDPQTVTTYTGPGTVQLTESTFAPTTVSLVRMGSITADVVATNRYADEFSSTDSTRTMNLRMAGSIPMTRLNPTSIFVGEFDYRITGFYRQHSVSTTTFPGLPPDTSTYDDVRVIEQAEVSGNHPGLGGIDDQDLFVARGTFTSESSGSYAPEPRSYSISAHDLHWHSVSDFPSYDRAKTLDGRADVTWSANHGAGCLNGTYVFRTDQLLEQSWYTGNVFLAGALKVNNALTLRYTSPYTRPLTTYPPVFQGTITLDLKRVGVTSIPYDYQAINVLQPLAQCQL
jgi:hypothetical protein